MESLKNEQAVQIKKYISTWYQDFGPIICHDLHKFAVTVSYREKNLIAFVTKTFAMYHQAFPSSLVVTDSSQPVTASLSIKPTVHVSKFWIHPRKQNSSQVKVNTIARQNGTRYNLTLILIQIFMEMNKVEN